MGYEAILYVILKIETMPKLLLFFHSYAEYTRGKDHFDNVSDYYAEDANDEFRALTFDEGNDIDALESALTDELDNLGFTSYYFESE